MRKSILFFFVLFPVFVLAQETLPIGIKGKVLADFGDLEGIYVINLKTEKTVITDKEGYFSIPAAVEDTLLFSSVQFKEVRLLLTDKYFYESEVVVRMIPKIHQLNEVVVRRYGNINAVSLGIIPANQKSYTPAERKLKTASGLNPTANAGSMSGGSISMDPLLNLISGRTAMLKKELEVEKKESYMRQLENMFDQSHFVEKFKIPLAYIKGFEFYAVENEKFTNILKTNNKTTIEFLLGQLATKYLEIIAGETK
jgi:hypothetical protein